MTSVPVTRPRHISKSSTSLSLCTSQPETGRSWWDTRSPTLFRGKEGAGQSKGGNSRIYLEVLLREGVRAGKGMLNHCAGMLDSSSPVPPGLRFKSPLVDEEKKRSSRGFVCREGCLGVLWVEPDFLVCPLPGTPTSPSPSLSWPPRFCTCSTLSSPAGPLHTLSLL